MYAYLVLKFEQFIGDRSAVIAILGSQTEKAFLRLGRMNHHVKQRFVVTLLFQVFRRSTTRWISNSSCRGRGSSRSDLCAHTRTIYIQCYARLCIDDTSMLFHRYSSFLINFCSPFLFFFKIKFIKFWNNFLKHSFCEIL